jgi:hypothetical protein
MIAKIGHILLAPRRCSTVRVRRSHISGEETKDVTKSHLIAVHVLLSLSACKIGQMRMCPSVGCNLMSFVVCSLDCRSPRKSGVVNFTFAVVVASDEEGGFGIVLLQYVQNMLGVDVWAVIVSNSNGSSHCTIVDTGSAVQDVTKLGSSDSRSASTGWDLVVIASRCEVELTSRCSTVVCAFTTPAWNMLGQDTSINSMILTSFRTAITICTRTEPRSTLTLSIGRSLTLVMNLRDS